MTRPVSDPAKKNYSTLGEFSKALTDNLKQAVKVLDGSAIGDPLEVAAMQYNLGESLLGLGEYGPLAVEVLGEGAGIRGRPVLGPDHLDTLGSMNNLALLRGHQNRREAGKGPAAL